MSDAPPPAPVSEDAVDGRSVSVGRVFAVVTVAVVAIVGFLALALRNAEPTPAHYVGLSMLIFTVGAVGVLMRRNALVLFMCIELMLNAVNIAFAVFARMHGNVQGQVMILFVMIVAAAEVAVGLAIIVLIFRRRHSTNVDDLSLMRW